MDYKIYTSDHDQVIASQSLLAKHIMNEASANGSDVQNVMARLNKFAQGLMRECDDFEASCSPDDMDSKILRTFLLDMSGSMRGDAMNYQMQTMKIVGDRMNEAGVPFYILGHTTVGWKGGKSRED